MISNDAKRLLREYIRKKLFTLIEEFEEAKTKYKGEQEDGRKENKN